MFAVRETPKPAWGWLYGIVTVMCGVLGVVEIAIPDGPARRVLECVVTLALFGAMAVWVRASRVALAVNAGDGGAARRPAIVPRRAVWRGPASGQAPGARDGSFGISHYVRVYVTAALPLRSFPRHRTLR